MPKTHYHKVKKCKVRKGQSDWQTLSEREVSRVYLRKNDRYTVTKFWYCPKCKKFIKDDEVYMW